MALDQELSGVWLVDAGEDLHERRLARAVFAGQGVDAVRIQLDAPIGHRGEGAELLHRVLKRDDWPVSFSCHVVTSSSRNETIQIRRKCATQQYACQLYASALNLPGKLERKAPWRCHNMNVSSLEFLKESP